MAYLGSMRERFSFLISTVFGLGLSPLAPGTVGSFAALLVYWFLPNVMLGPILSVLIFILGLWALASFKRPLHDDGRIVIDEWIGQWITLWFLPKKIWIFVCAFVLFRLFDIVKPFPADWFDEKCKGHWSVLMDDVVSGVYASSVMWAMVLFGQRIWL